MERYYPKTVDGIIKIYDRKPNAAGVSDLCVRKYRTEKDFSRT